MYPIELIINMLLAPSIHCLLNAYCLWIPVDCLLIAYNGRAAWAGHGSWDRSPMHPPPGPVGPTGRPSHGLDPYQ